MLPFEYIVAIGIYRDPEMDLQIPQSHLAFEFTRVYRAGERGWSIQDFSLDRSSCFVFVPRAVKKLPKNWDERDLRS